ncbi:response regulator [Xanthovirga aplysinae]|uniref:response regulator n=1 Tax=Xanthovirga aplysinae TaxID=2529853 RepID=UPI0012BB876D|nr:response regulator [Xanthovirga aplysinae]MTI30339.1 response regulator [Xanthovirga aplysinae]
MSEVFENFSLLVADDDYHNVEVILSFLNGETDEVYYAPNGKVACELAKKKKPDLIIMDWQMPKMDGIEAIKILQSSNETKEIPIIVATGVKTSVENLSEALEAGAVDYLKKPFNPIEFRARITSTLRLNRQHELIKNLLEQEKIYVQQVLEHKERELASMAICDFQKTTLLNELLKQLNRLDKITKYVYATDIKSIEKQLKAQIDLGQSWDTFKLHFEEMHIGFFESLDASYPSLTLKERKLCAYIKMGMGNFEICQMTGTSDDALRKAINRLKKKLGQGPKDDIRKFLFDL